MARIFHLLFLFGALLGAAAAPIPVALMNLGCDDLSIRSALAAAEYAALIQAPLPADPEFTWVERAELDRAARELSLSRLMGAERADALQAGRWLGATWGVYGRFSTNRSGQRDLTLELVDLPRASTIARTNLGIASPGRTLKVSDAEAQRVADLLRTWLPAQRADWERQQTRPRVAILPLTGGRGRSLDEFLGAAPEPADASGPLWQPLSRAGQATDEAELALGGFTRTGAPTSPPPRLADAFVWGRAESRPVPGQVPFSNHIVVAAWIWDGRGAPEAVTFGPFDAGSEAQAAAAVRTGLQQRLKLDPHPSPDTPGGALPAEWMTQVLQEGRLNGTGALDTPETFRGWLRAVQMLEVVCFLNPADAQAQEAWLRLRFSNGARDRAINPFLFKARAAAAWGQYVDRFGFAGSTNLTWTAYRFRPVVAQYFDWLDVSLEQTDSGQHPNDFSPTFYTDWYARRAIELAARWMKARTEPGAEEFALLIRNKVVPSGFEASPVAGASERFAAVADAFQRFPPRSVQRFHQDPPYPPAVQRLAADAGQPGAADAFLAAISVSTNWPPVTRTAPRLPKEDSLPRPADPAPDTQRSAPSSRAPGSILSPFNSPPVRIRMNPAEPAPSDVPSGQPLLQPSFAGSPALAAAGRSTFRLPRIAELDSDQDRVLLDVQEPDFSPPIQKVATDPIPFPQPRMEAVTQIVPGAGGLWLVARGIESVSVDAASPEASLDLRQPEQRFERLWWLPEDELQPRRVSTLAGPHSVTAVSADGGGVWAGLADGSICWLAHPLAEPVWRTNGLQSGPVAALAVDDGKVLALGLGWWCWDASSWHRLPAPPDGQEFPATPGYGSWTRVGPDRVAAFSRWARWDLSQSQWKPMSAPAHPVPAFTAGTADGWLLAGGWQGLRGLQLERGETWSASTRQALRIFPGFGSDRRSGPNPEQIRSLQALLNRRATERALLPGRLPGPVTALALHGEFLWVGVFRREEVRRGAVLLIHVPSRRWVCRILLTVPPASLSVDGRHLWVGSSRATGGGLEPPLSRLRIDSLLHIPESAWLSLNPEPSEVQQALDALPARDRAVYELFRGNPGSVIELLAALPEDSWSAEDTFLRWLAADLPGRELTSEASRWKTLLQERWPDSSFTQALNPAERPGMPLRPGSPGSILLRVPR